MAYQYGRERSASVGSPTQYSKFSFNQGARTYLSGQQSTAASGQNALADYNRLVKTLQSSQMGGKYLNRYNKDKYLTALGYLRDKAQSNAELRYAEYLQSAGDPKFASKLGPGQSLLRPSDEYDLSENTGSYRGDPTALFNSVDTNKYYKPFSSSGGNWAGRLTNRFQSSKGFGIHSSYNR